MNVFTKRITLVYLPSLVLLAVFAAKTTVAINHNNSFVPADKVNQQKRIPLLSGRVSFMPPADFRAVTQKRLKRKLPENANPLLILANVKQTGVITVEYLEDVSLNSGQLTEVKRFLEGTFRASNLEWITSEIAETNQRQWFHFEWEKDVSELSRLVAPVPVDDEQTAAISDDIPIHYHEYKTVYKGKLLSFSFEAELSAYPKLKDNFIKSMESIRIRD